MNHSHSKNCNHGHSHNALNANQRFDFIFALIAATCLIGGFVASQIIGEVNFYIKIVYGLSYFFGGYFACVEAFESIQHKKIKIDSLMILAAVGAAFLDKWSEGALLLTLFSLGHSLEHFALSKAQNAINALSELTPDMAWVRRKGELVEVPVEDIEFNEIVIVKPHQSIPVDAYVIVGTSAVNQAAVTGESMPVEKRAYNLSELNPSKKIPKESLVFAGTLNGEGHLELKVLKKSTESTLARVARMVSEAQTEKSPTQKLTEKFETLFVPTVLILVFILLFAFLVVDESFGESFYRAMAVLIAASPCALAISTPSAVLSGIARAGKSGVLIKGGAALESLGSVDAIAFDKTGTLTEGHPKLTDYKLASGKDLQMLMKLIVALESKSEHPLAIALVDGAKTHLDNSISPEASDVKSLVGRGVSGIFEGKLSYVAKPGFFDSESGLPIPPQDISNEVKKFQNQGKTCMIVVWGEEYLGVLAMMDAPRLGVRNVVQEFRKLGVNYLTILSGDNQGIVEAVAREVGIPEAHGNLMPEDKVIVIKKLQQSGFRVAMLGDGVNDAPAMAISNVGIAMGAMGSDVALEAADVALMTDDLNHLVYATRLCRKARVIIKQNIWISLGVVGLLVPATILGLGIGPAVILHEGSTVVVVLNALRLLGYKY